MNFDVPNIGIYVIAWAAIIAAIWFLFDKTEEILTPVTKTAISRWLMNLHSTDPLINWPSTFGAIFDQVFGKRHRSFQCFSKSSVASIFAVIIVSFLWAALRRDEYLAFIRSENFPILLIIIPTGIVIFNWFPDYLSLLETRVVIKWLSIRSSVMSTVVLLSFDFLITTLIGFGAWMLFMGPIVALNEGEAILPRTTEALSDFGSYVLPLSVDSPGGIPLGVWFYSTFFTSVWIWIFVLSGLVLRVT